MALKAPDAPAFPFLAGRDQKVPVIFGKPGDCRVYNVVFCVLSVLNIRSNRKYWYRVYSDNWCEQGGRFTSNDATSTTVTLMKAYRDTNYLPMICMYGLNGAAQYRTFQVQTINTNSMLVWNCTNGTNTCLWRCEGYI